MKNAHILSKQYILDPAYSSQKRMPLTPTSSVFGSAKSSDAPCWLYLPGDLEASLLIRLRHEAFQGCRYVGHPGRFRAFSPILYARYSFPLAAIPKGGTLSFCFSGVMILTINGQQIFHGASESQPRWQTLSLRPHLNVGNNCVGVRLHQIGEPPTFILRSAFLKTDAAWQVSQDSIIWTDTACSTFSGLTCFPHQERLPTMRLTPKEKTGEIYDFGLELLGRPEVRITAKALPIVMQPGESVAEALNTDPVAEEQSVTPLFNDAGLLTTREELALRFLRVSPHTPRDVRDVAFQASLHPVCYRGAFACSDERLNKIWMRSAYTLRLCMREFFVDGLKRDRMGWVGDLYLSLLSNAYTFAEQDIERRSITALYGADPIVCEFNGIIDYTLFWVISLWTHLLHHHDPDYLMMMRQKLYALMATLEAKEDESGLLPSARFGWIFIDWAPIVKDGHSSCLQMIYAMALDAARKIALVDKNPERAAYYARKANHVRRQCRALFWNEPRHLFMDNSVNGKQGTAVSRHANFLAFLSGVITPSAYRKVLDHLERTPEATPVGTPYMMALESTALCRAGRPARMLASLRDYWGGMLDCGATTFWEAHDPHTDEAGRLAFYNRPYGKSLCHAWSAGPAFLLPGELMGIRPLEPGWRRFAVTPALGDLTWACATVPTPHGDIKVEAEGKRLTVHAPRGTVWANKR